MIMRCFFVISLISAAFRCLIAQCPVNQSCNGISEDEMLFPVTVPYGQAIDKERYSVCLDEASIIEDSKFINYAGDAIKAVVLINTDTLVDKLFISAFTSEGTYNTIVNVFEGNNCFEASYKISSKDVKTPEVLGVDAVTGMNYIVEVLIPININLDFEPQDLIIEVFSIGQFENCSNTDLNGTNDEITFSLKDRSLGEGAAPLYPGELVLLEINYNYVKPLQNNPEWLHGIIPIIGDAWIYDFSIDDNSIIRNGNDTLNEAKYSPADNCGLVLREDLPYFCSYTNNNGQLKLCNTLIENCPCEVTSLSSGDALGEGWSFSSQSTCTETCSESDNWGIGFTEVNIQMLLKLQVSPDVSTSNDFQIGILSLSDAISGCYSPPIAICVPAFASYSPNWTTVDQSKTYGILGALENDVCYGQNASISVALNKIGEEGAFVTVEEKPGIVYTDGVIQIENDTLLNLTMLNETDSIIHVDINLFVEDNGTTSQVGNTVLNILPRLKLSTTDLRTCSGSCNNVMITSNHNRSYQTFRTDGGNSFLPNEQILICPNDTIELFADEGLCGSDTISFFIEPVEDIKTFITKPSRMCRNGIVETEPLNILTIDSITGGVPPYTVNFFGGVAATKVPQENGEFARYIVNEEAIFCGESEFVSTPMLIDSTVDVGDFCKDGIFDFENPQIVLKLEDYGKDIVDFEWEAEFSISGNENPEGDFVVNEEESDFTNENFGPPVRCDINFSDGCDVTTFYKVNIFDNERDFDFSVVNFEVDFNLTNSDGIEVINWNFGDGNFSDDYFPTHIYEEKGIYNVIVEIIDFCDTTTVSKLVMVGSVDTEEVEANKITFTPNPASNFLAISSDDEKYKLLEIFKIDGSAIYEEKLRFSGNIFDVDVSDIPVGIYICRLSSSESVVSKRVIIQR